MFHCARRVGWKNASRRFSTAVNPRVFFDIELDGQAAGKIVMELRAGEIVNLGLLDH